MNNGFLVSMVKNIFRIFAINYNNSEYNNKFVIEFQDK